MHCSVIDMSYVLHNIWSNLIYSAFVWFLLNFFPLSSLVNFFHVIHLQADSTRNASIFITFVPSPPFLHCSPHHVIRYLVIRWIPKGWYVCRQTWETFLISFINLSLHSSVPPPCASNRLLCHLRFSWRVAGSDTELIRHFNGSHLNHIHPCILKTTLVYLISAETAYWKTVKIYFQTHFFNILTVCLHTAVSWRWPNEYRNYYLCNLGSHTEWVNNDHATCIAITWS